MAITSHAFGRVTLTDSDAEKFKKQVTFGRTSEKAKASVASGLKSAKAFKANGKVSFSLAKKPKG